MADLFPDLTMEELLVDGLCECGDPLDGHPPLPAPRDSWKSERQTPAEFRSGSSLPGVRSLTEAQLRARRELGGAITPSQRPWSRPR